MSFRLKLLSVACAGVLLQIAPAIAQNQRNLILFVPDGLRPLSVTPETAPTLAAIRDKGVNFSNPHAL
ncbi:MAG: alkaline phosphatase family protein, partial [Pseudolabrys sp.]